MMHITTFDEWVLQNGISDISMDSHFDYIHDVFKKYTPLHKNNSWKYMQNEIYENLMSSYDAEKLKEKIKAKFDKDILRFETESDVSPKMIVIKYKFNYDFIKSDIFKQLLSVFNYNITFIDPEGRLVYLEPNIPDEMTQYVYENCNGILFHITKNRQTFENIMKYGLKPKTSSYRNYSERIFLITGQTKDEIFKNLSKTKDIFLNSENHKDMVLLKIDLNKFDKKLRFFLDTTIKNMRAIWTSEYIPPFCITKINFYDLDKEFKRF